MKDYIIENHWNMYNDNYTFRPQRIYQEKNTYTFIVIDDLSDDNKSYYMNSITDIRDWWYLTVNERILCETLCHARH